jgi:hypothetical protein
VALRDCAVLGVDAAWAPANPSGVALVSRVGGRLSVDAVSSSFAGFLEIAPSGQPSRPPALSDVIRAAKRLARAPLTCVAMDIPLSRKRINGRRTAVLVGGVIVAALLGALAIRVHELTQEED